MDYEEINNNHNDNSIKSEPERFYPDINAMVHIKEESEDRCSNSIFEAFELQATTFLKTENEYSNTENEETDQEQFDGFKENNHTKKPSERAKTHNLLHTLLTHIPVVLLSKLHLRKTCDSNDAKARVLKCSSENTANKSNDVFKLDSSKTSSTRIQNKSEKCKLKRKKKKCGDKRHSCSVCSKTFSKMYGLTRHERVHSSNKSFNCEYCPKSYKQPYSLKVHLFQHKKTKYYKCGTCNKKFALEGYLKKHIDTHSNQKRFQCDKCGRSYKEKRTLINHMLDHTGERDRVNCNICGADFGEKRALRKHMIKNRHRKYNYRRNKH